MKTVSKTMGVYGITLIIDGRIYCGSSRGCETRLYTHLRQLRGNRHPNRYLQAAWNKYGEGEFVFEILEKVDDEMWLRAREQAWINRTKTRSFNLHSNAWMAKELTPNESSVDRIREGLKNYYAISENRERHSRLTKIGMAVNNYWGTHEARQHQSKRQLEIQNRPEIKEKKSISMKKTLQAPEQKERLRKNGIEVGRRIDVLTRRSKTLKATLQGLSHKKRLSENGKKRAKSYNLITPEGTIVGVFNLRGFCKKNGFHYPKMCEAANGKRVYKGWHGLIEGKE